MQRTISASPSLRPGLGTILYPGGAAFRVWAPFASSVFAAGALCVALKATALTTDASDAARVAIGAFLSTEQNLEAALGNSRNGRRLLANPELRADVAFCSRRDVWDVVPEMNSAGWLVGKNGGVPER